MRKTAVILFAALFIACSVPINASAGPSDDIPTNAQGTGVHNTLVDLLVKADLVTTLQGAGPFTVFAPTDQAFTDAGIDPANFNTQEEIDVLTDILLYHVVSGSVTSGDLSDGMSAAAVNNDPLLFSVNGADVKVNDASVTTADVTSSNGVIHVVDQVLLPPIDVYVSEGTFASPYYQFYSDDAGNSPLNEIDISRNHKFHRLGGATLHAFYLGDNGYEAQSSAELTIIGDGSPTAGIQGSETFTVFFNDGFTTDDTLTYFCTQHSSMFATFTLTEPLNDIPTVASGTGIHNTLVNALTQANLVATLQGAGPFTVFAPTDQAFTDLGVDLSTLSESDLSNILLHHVYSGSVPSSAVTDGMMAEMVNGDKVAFTNDGTTVTVGSATVTQANVPASNGIIHVIDKVLMPPADIPTTASGTGVHNTLVSAVVDANLLATLEGEGPFTVFAPTDQAFIDLGVDLSTLTESELSNILLYHVVQSEVPASAVTECLSANAANTQPLSFTVSDSGVMVNDANITMTDVISSNGLIHVIDKVLMPTDTPRDIPRTAQCNGEHDSLVAAVIQADLLTTLQGDGPFTVFAPTDQAFTDAGIDLAALDTPEGKQTLSDILLYHVVDSSVPSSALTDGMVATAVNGDDLTFDLTDGVKVNDATVTGADVATSNGIIHVIDKVLLPPADPVDIPTTAAGTGIHNSLVAAVVQAELLATLEGDGPFTVFAPTDQAFTDAGIDLAALDTPEGKQTLSNILLYHVVSSSVPASAVTDCMSADAANGQPLSFTVNEGVMVNDANVIQADVTASNGIIHVIDKVLTPSDNPRDIPRTAQCTGSHNSLVAAVIQAELLTTLQGDGPFTVFAPTDQAFTDAGIDLAAFDTPEGKTQLIDILQYHVLDSEVPSSAVTDCLSVNAINALPLSFTVDGGVMVNDANVVTPDVATSNGVIHVIDKVLTPTATPTDIPRTAQCTGVHNTLVAAVVQADLLTTLQGDGPFTLFAPTDQAFIDAGINLAALNTEEGKATLTDILLHHVYISDSIWASQIEDGQVVSMANGDNITLTKVDGKIMIGDVTVADSDVLVSNGIIHVVDKVIMPPSDEVNDANDETEGASDDDSSNIIWIGLAVVLIIVGIIGAVLFVRSKGAAATLAKDFSSGGLMNQLQPVEESLYPTQATQQVTPQATYQPQPVETVEVVQQPAVAEPTILRQWTDEAGYTWRVMDDGKTYWWTGSDWQIYG